ncbi:MAG: phage holin family protein [Weeksellaceae bacterium]|jgi:putative membrane protein|nr:phage holin family protein [Weeksellaceae bacterium]
MKTIVGFVVTALLVMALSYLLPGIQVNGFVWALILALVLGLLNSIVKPLLVFFTLPATLVTFGLFLFVINAVIVLIASWLIGDNFHVDGFWWALLFSILLSAFQSIIGFDKQT